MGTVPNHRGDEVFREHWNFAPGTDKFNNSSNLETRITAKAMAFVDVVAPASALLTSHEIIPPNDQFNRRAYPYEYHVNVHGTSQASPFVAGICQQILSVNYKMGTSGPDVQRKVYDVVTFTADKLKDQNNLLPEYITRDGQGNPVVHKFHTTQLDGTPFQFHYVEQANDQLKRTWAQRMGFGKVNAYRAVAHAIPLKGANVYEPTGTSLTLDYSTASTNERNEKLMHWGAFANELHDIGEDRNGGGLNDVRLRVLEYGGADLLSGVDEHNNQGYTRREIHFKKLNQRLKKNTEFSLPKTTSITLLRSPHPNITKP